MFLVDGYNAIRRVPQLRAAETRRGLEAGRDALVARILESGIVRSRPVVVVFDGELSASTGSSGQHRNLSLRFAKSADDAIVDAVNRSEQREKTTVVTADIDLSWRVKRLGAAVVLPESWPPLASGRSRARPRARASRAPSEKPSPSKAEVDYWLKVFEGQGDDD